MIFLLPISNKYQFKELIIIDGFLKNVYRKEKNTSFPPFFSNLDNQAY